MTKEQVDMYFTANAKYFPSESIALLREKMLKAGEDRDIFIQSVKLKEPTTLLIVSIFLGSLGIDRFMAGDTGLGVLKLLTGGVCGIMAIVDWFIIMKRAREKNLQAMLAVL